MKTKLLCGDELSMMSFMQQATEEKGWMPGVPVLASEAQNLCFSIGFLCGVCSVSLVSVYLPYLFISRNTSHRYFEDKQHKEKYSKARNIIALEAADVL